MKLTIDWLKNNCKMLHYFGLGFIQLKLSQEKRLHFYTPELPPIIPDEDIHNHRYDFQSTILLGKLFQELYELIPGDTYVKQDETCQADMKAETDIQKCGIRLVSNHIYTMGSSYFINHETFHRIKAMGPCITSINRTDYKKTLAQVVRPDGEVSICPFSQKVDEDRLWSIIEGMCSWGE